MENNSISAFPKLPGLSVEDVAIELNRSYSTARLVNSGDLEAIRVGGRLRVTRRSLDAYVERVRQEWDRALA
ncbi:MAG TPA: helix-turn-helix domain-containing protein [Mycobacteriales bacterium]|nr:helix-turn-helix domain-containing protein [Mycobacteriales bacterium]